LYLRKQKNRAKLDGRKLTVNPAHTLDAALVQWQLDYHHQTKTR
jgi:acyl CoA:acetate/3-ketoacid CoA transferase alpha subunit